MTNGAEFDRYADAYRSAHARNVRITGESPEYFAEYKVKLLGRLCQRYGLFPRLIVDFGTGLGASLPHLASEFPMARILGTDVSSRSLEFARQFESERVQVLLHEGTMIPVTDGTADVVFVACVLHHVPIAQRPILLSQLARKIRPGGWLCVFEHNPWNPLTRHAVSTCVLDQNAELLTQPLTVQLVREAGLRVLTKGFTLFFPHVLRALRPLESSMGWLPLGAQYFVLGEAIGGGAPAEEKP